MARQVLPSRRPSVTSKVRVLMDNEREIKILITIGFDPAGRPAEVFCADFKAGTALHSIVMDACICFSRLLQHGDTPKDILRGMSAPLSLLGAIASAVAEFECPPDTGKTEPEPEPEPVRPRPTEPTGGVLEEVVP